MDEDDSIASDPSTEPSGAVPNETQSKTSTSSPGEPLKSDPPTTAPPNSFWRELTLASIQHANRSIAILLIAIMVAGGVYLARKELGCWLANAESVKAGSFEVRLRLGVSSNKLDAEFSKLVDLNDQQLQLFLVLGKQRGSNAAGEYGIAYTGEEVTKTNLDKLQEIGLLTGVEVNGPNHYKWDVTQKGLNLHRLLLEHIVGSIKDAAACQCETPACKCQ